MKNYILVLLTLLLFSTVVMADEFEEERVTLLTVGYAGFHAETMVLLSILNSPTFEGTESLSQRLWGPMVRLHFKIRDWFRAGICASLGQTTFTYTEAGKLDSSFDMTLNSYFFGLQAQFSILDLDWAQLFLTPQVSFYGGGNSANNIVNYNETREEAIYRTSNRYEGVGLGGNLTLNIYLSDFFITLEGGWLQGGIDVEEKIVQEADGEHEEFSVSPSSEIGDYTVFAGAGFYL